MYMTHFRTLQVTSTMLATLIVAALASAAAASSRWSVPGVRAGQAAFAASPLNLDVYGTKQFMLDGNVSLTGDWDAVTLDFSGYGIPYSSFMYEEPQPVSWAARVATALGDITGSWRLPVILQLPVVDGSCPPMNATDSPGGSTPSVNSFTGCSSCFDFSEVRNPVAAFVKQGIINYQVYMSLAVNLTGTLALLQYGVDANTYFAAGCGDDLNAAYVEYLAQTYVTLKQLFPDKAVFPSFSVEVMMGASNGQACAGQLATGGSKPSAALVACTKAGYAELTGIPRDLFAFSATPSVYTLGPKTPGFRPWYITLPVSVLTGIDADVVAVTSTGLTTNTIAVNFANGSTPMTTLAADPTPQCGPALVSNATYATSWFTTLMNGLPAGKTLFVAMTAARDIFFPAAMACPCTAPLPVLQAYCDTLSLYRQVCQAGGLLPVDCELSLKLRGQLGVRDLFGNQVQPLYNAVQAARAG